MRLKYRKGDILKSNCQHIAHGCNAQGKMGAGLALEIKKRYPRAYEDYYFQYIRDHLIPGSIIISPQRDGKTIINMVIQRYYGRNPDIRYCDYDAIDSCFNLVNDIEDCFELAIPKIGCGLANGDWNIISDIIERNSVNYQTVVYEL